MPELPEVEEVRRTLEPHVLGRVVTAAAALRPDFVTPPDAPLASLAGQTFVQTLRHGKKLFLELNAGPTLLIHLGMSGRVDVVPTATPLEKHTHVVFTLNSGMDVRCRDPRRFGGVWYYPTLRQALAEEVTPRMGPDALALETSHLAHWKQTRGRLKARLLSQKDVAGLGNIYVDEALWQSCLHPLQGVRRIRPPELDRLVQAVREVLGRSIASGGTTLRDYRNVSDQPGGFARQLRAYGRAGKPCERCGQTLQGARVAGRTTVFCPACQKRR